MDAVKSEEGDPDAFDPRLFAGMVTSVPGRNRREHAVISDGLRRIRLDLRSGTLLAGPVTFHYRLCGLQAAGPKLPPLQRLVALGRHRRFLSSLFPPDPRMARWIDVLRVHDGLADGASQRDLAAALYGTSRVQEDWQDGAGSLRSRVRRLIAEANAMAQGSYRGLMLGNNLS